MSVPGPIARASGAAAAAALWAIAFVHALWATGSNWPADDRDSLADLVVGIRPFPSNSATWIVAIALVAAGGIIAWRAGVSTFGGSDRPIARYAAWAIVAVFLLRGAAGFVVSGFEFREAAEPFLYWDLRLYSPLCLALGLASALVALRRS